MFQLVPILVLAILSAIGATGYIVVQQNKQIETLSNQVKTLQVSPTASPSPTITPTSEPTSTPTKKPYVKPTYAPGEAPAIEPLGNQKALIEIENKMAQMKAAIQKYQADYNNLQKSEYADSGYVDIVLKEIARLDAQYKDLEKQRWQVMAEQ